MTGRTPPEPRRGAFALLETLSALFARQERDMRPTARPLSASELDAEKRRYAAQCMLLGLEACRRHDARRAVDTFHEAFVAFQATGDRRSASLMQKAIGLVAQKIETPAKVRAAFKQARAMLQQAGLKDEEARALFLLADFEARQAAWSEAYALYEDSLQISRSIDYVVGEVECLCRYGWSLKAEGRVDEAKRRILDARKAAHDHGDDVLIRRVTSWMQKFGPDEAAPAKASRSTKGVAVVAPAAGGAQRPWQPIESGAHDARPAVTPPKGSIAAIQQAKAAAAPVRSAAAQQPASVLKRRARASARRLG